MPLTRGINRDPVGKEKCGFQGPRPSNKKQTLNMALETATVTYH